MAQDYHFEMLHPKIIETTSRTSLRILTPRQNRVRGESNLAPMFTPLREEVFKKLSWPQLGVRPEKPESGHSRGCPRDFGSTRRTLGGLAAGAGLQGSLPRG